jgi:hypothetical protein
MNQGRLDRLGTPLVASPGCPRAPSGCPIFCSSGTKDLAKVISPKRSGYNCSGLARARGFPTIQDCKGLSFVYFQSVLLSIEVEAKGGSPRDLSHPCRVLYSSGDQARGAMTSMPRQKGREESKIGQCRHSPRAVRDPNRPVSKSGCT